MQLTEPWRSWRVSDVVIDSSVAVAWALPDEHLHPAAVRFIGGLVDGRLTPVVAAHFAFEVRHALIRAARAGRVDWVNVPGWMLAIDGLEPVIASLNPKDEVIIDLAQRHGLTWGDAHWVEVARRLDRPLLTADQRLARSVPDEVAIVVYLGDDEAA